MEKVCFRKNVKGKEKDFSDLCSNYHCAQLAVVDNLEKEKVLVIPPNY
jgi:hypothetical protein